MYVTCVDNKNQLEGVRDGDLGVTMHKSKCERILPIRKSEVRKEF